MDFRSSPTARLVLFLLAGKAAVVSAVLVLVRNPSVLQGLGTKWDSSYYEAIAAHGYGPSAPYVFSPAYPIAIRALLFVLGNPWVSALVVTNSLSFVFPILLYKAFGYRTALLAELFPTYLVFTTVAYSDVVALTLLAATFLFVMRNRLARSSLALSGAIFAFYSLALTLPSFLLLAREKRRATLLFFVAPLLTGAGILLWFKLQTGGYFSLFALEAPWEVGVANPVAQALYLLCSQGQGSFTCQPWAVGGIVLPPPYWEVRNLLFEGFYMFGAVYLLKAGVRYRVFLSVYSLSVVVPLLFTTGFPALSIPRLLLPAFPVFIGYAEILQGPRRTTVYIAVCLVLAALVSIIQYFAIFA